MTGHRSETVEPRNVACSWCGRTVAVVKNEHGPVICRHDNRNNSGFCKGSLMPALWGAS